MLGSTLASPVGLLGLLYLSTLAVAAPAGYTPTVTTGEPRVWPQSGESRRYNARNDDTNAKRLARGLTLKAPTRRYDPERRMEAAPAQASSTSPVETFTFLECSGGGGYSGSEYTYTTYASDSDLVDQCAQNAAAGGYTSFFITDNGGGPGYCYTGANSYTASACTATNYAIYTLNT